MRPVFIALTPAGLATAQRAAAAIGGDVHSFSTTASESFSRREKVAAEQPDEGMRRGTAYPQRSIPSPVASGDTLSLWEREGFAPHLRSLFESGRPIVGVCAAGILIRILAPLLSDKREEPPVIALSEDGASVVPLLGGHRGANDLARALAAALSGHAAITTAGDTRFGVALDAPPQGWTLANPADAKPVMAALLAGAAARLDGDAPWLSASRIRFAPDAEIRLVATTRAIAGDSRTLVYHPRRLAIGIGCERNAEPGEAIALLHRTLDEAGLAPASVALVASIDVKADEAAVLEAAAHLGVPARFFSAAALEEETPRLANPSDIVFREVGCHGVAEGAALAAAGADGRLVVGKRKSARVTCAIAEAPDIIDPSCVGRARGKLAIVGIGPGSSEWLTPEARALLQGCDAAIGYSLYLDLVSPLIAQAERFDSALGSEEARVRKALSLAAEGRNVALVSSGDAGIYAMATLAFECLGEDRQLSRQPQSFSDRERVAAAFPAEPVPPTSLATGEGDHAQHGGGGSHDHGVRHPPPPPAAPVPLPRFAGEDLPPAASRIEIVVAPGISAMQAAAARAGAPLGHDFCAISLSDLLTPWEAIEARICAAAEGDFVIAFYNPVSERRRTQLAAAKTILLRHRPAETPVVLARNLGREGERVTTIPLGDLDVDMVDMLTLVLVGASSTRQVEAGGRIFTYTPRGYEKKRNGAAAPSPPQDAKGSA